VSLLLALPLLPLLVAGWLAVSSRSAQLATGWTVAVVAVLPVAVAALYPADRLAFPELLVRGDSALVLDHTARAALLLFGGLWLITGLLLTRTREPGPTTTALLVALSGALTLALAEGGPLVYAGMLATGYGLYAVMATEPGDDWRRAARAFIVLLVASDLLVFEMLLSATAEPGLEVSQKLLLLGLVALSLRGSVPPAHAWLPPALAAVGTPVALLLVVVPPGMALFGALKLLPAGAGGIALLCALLGFFGAAWVAVAGLAQRQARPTLGYAVAASAALLLTALPAGGGPDGELAWLALALLAPCAALPLVALQTAGWSRDISIALALLVHGMAGGHVAAHAATALPGWAGMLAPAVAVTASLLLTLVARRTAAAARDDASIETTRLAFAPIVLGCIGLALAWLASWPGFASAWPAPVGITLGLVIFRALPAATAPRIPPGDLLGPLERLLAAPLQQLGALFLRRLPRARDRTEAALLALWDGAAWSRRIQRLDLRLRAWPATSLMMLLVALAAALLLVK
jgi:hypothetical protein